MQTNLKHPFSQQSIRDLSAFRQEPEWLLTLRLEAWARFETLQQEAEIADLDLSKLNAWQDPPEKAVPEAQWPEGLRHTVDECGDEEALIIHRDSTMLSRSLTKDSAKRGVIFTDLSTAVKLHGDLVRRALGKQIFIDDAWTALNAAFWTGGSFLYVPEHVHITLPFHVCYWMSAANSSVFPRTLILIEKGSTVYFMDEFLSPAWQHPGLSSAVVEVEMGEKAQLDYIQLQNWGPHVAHIQRLASDVDPTANLQSWTAAMGGPTQRVTLQLDRQLGNRRSSETAHAGSVPENASEDERFLEASRFFDPQLVKLKNESVHEKILHYLVGKVTGYRRRRTLQRASELHPEVRL